MYFLLIYLFIHLFIYLYFEKENVQEGHRGRERERISSRLCTVSAEPDVGKDITNCEIMT